MKKDESEDSYSHILKYTGVFGGVQGLCILIGIIRNKLVAMLLGPGGMGLMSLFNSTIKLVSDSTNLGISISAVREISEAYEQDDEQKFFHKIALIRTWSLLVAVVGTVLCVLLSPLLNKWTFDWGDHTLHFIFLSPVVGLIAITTSELAILKGTRQLRHLAALSVYNVVAALVITIPLYYFWNESAIVPSLVLLSLSQMIITIAYSYRLYPLKIIFHRKIIGEGLGMVKLGVAFVLAGVMGSGAEFVIRSFLNNTGGLDNVGLYNAGYMMTMTYVGMVFSAMETDYFPRLSSVSGVGETLNLTVNRQIEVSFLLVSPLLVFFIVFLPILLPLLYSGKFLPISGMMKVTILAMYFRAITLPIEYIPLARGDSKSYLLLEVFYDIIVVILVILGFHFKGLTGMGIGLFLSGLLNVVAVLVYNHHRYGYYLSSRVRNYILMQMPIGCITYLVSIYLNGILYWLIGSVLFIVSFSVTLIVLHSKTHLWSSLVSKMSSKFHHE